MNLLPAWVKVFICIFIFIFYIPNRVLSAEILQVTSSSILQIGDNNRTYKVRIYGINIDPSKEKEAATWLRSNLPRSSKVNLFPKGFDEETLISEVVKLKTNQDIAHEMIKLGFGQENLD